MLNEFIRFSTELFPSISPYTKDEVRKAIQQFKDYGRQYQFCMPQPFDFLTQGDIISEIPFIRYKENGERETARFKGMLLSNTCDAERDPALLFAPLLPIDEIDADRQAVLNNTVYRLLYIPDSDLLEYAIDLSLINSIPRKVILKGIEMGRIHKVASLNRLGYYLFLTKLTVHLMRPEDTGVQADRNDESA